MSQDYRTLLMKKGVDETRPKVYADDLYTGAHDGLGYCAHPDCFEEAYGVEPDACNYTCESCNRESVFGIEECVMLEIVEVIEGPKDFEEYTMEDIIDRNIEDYDKMEAMLQGGKK